MLFAVLSVVRQLISLLFVSESSSDVTLVEFCAYAQIHFATQKSLTPAGWNESVPSAEEKKQMAELVTRIYSLDDFENFDSSLKEFPDLEKVVKITRIKNYLVIHEHFPPNGKLFARNWGLLAIADPRSVARTLHHSAVHFDSEGPIYEEAAHVCQDSHSRSLALHGASRYAISPTLSSKCQKKYTASDGAHNADTMFHFWSATILKLSRELDEDFTFVQWHGMAETSCPSSDVFVSAGSKSPSVYKNSVPAVQLSEAFNRLNDTLKCSHPGSDPTCRLVASDNPLGRLINGVSSERVCSTSAKDNNVTGRFLHIEQKARPREAIDLWIDVIEEVFPEERKTTHERNSIKNELKRI